MLRKFAKAALMEKEPGTSPELLRYLDGLHDDAFAIVMCGLEHLVLSYEDDFKLLGDAR